MVWQLVTAFVIASLAMAVLWIWHRRLGNAYVAHAGWALTVGALAVLFANLGTGAWVRRSSIAWMMGSWGARLGVHVMWSRVLTRADDRQHGEQAVASATDAPLKSFWWFESYAIGAVFFSLPALLACADPNRALSPMELGGAVVWLVGFAAETTADRQLLRFNADPANRDRACRVGLWRLSPHANDVFEVIVWTGFALFAAPSPSGWMAFACPLAMVWLLVRAIRADPKSHSTAVALPQRLGGPP
jgi:steroid 5-alpha reductase family enzyme